MPLSQRLTPSKLAYSNNYSNNFNTALRHLPMTTQVTTLFRTPKSLPIKPYYHTVIVAPNLLNNHDAAQHILNAQRLRTLSFSQAFGVSFTGFHPNFEQPLDSDSFDNYCTHVLIYDITKQDSVGQPLLVATTRLLDRQGAVNAGHFYSENEFKLGNLLAQYPYNVLEMGRTCVHPHYRDVATIHQLWSAIGKVAKSFDVNAFMGCASIPLENEVMQAEAIQQWLDSQAAGIKLAIKVTQKLPMTKLVDSKIQRGSPAPALPALLKMYLRMGCSIGNTACYDADFDCADIFIWLPFEQIKPRYQHYIA